MDLRGIEPPTSRVRFCDPETEASFYAGFSEVEASKGNAPTHVSPHRSIRVHSDWDWPTVATPMGLSVADELGCDGYLDEATRSGRRHEPRDRLSEVRTERGR